MSETINPNPTGKNLSPPNRPSHKPVDPLNPTVRLKKEDQSHFPFSLKGFHRLDAALANDQPLRNNVPRGYYVNILV